MRTAVDIHDAKLAKLRQLAVQRKQPLRGTVDEVLEAGLAATAKPGPKRAIPLPVFDFGLQPTYRNQSLNQVYDLWELDALGARS